MLLALQNVAKSYESIEVLHDVSLQLGEGDSVAIVGPSGSGKSTLLNLMGALDRPTTGHVLFDGQDLAAQTDNELAALRNRKIGFVFQLHHLLPQCTIMENVLIPAMANPAANMDDLLSRAERLLDRVGLKQRQTHRPGQLSVGERQRTAVVRALINQPKLLLADEPTGSLDRAAAENLGQLLVDLNREETVALVVVTHSTELAKRMSHVFELRDGGLSPL